MDIIHKLETLNSLKEKGIITATEFQSQKERLLKANLQANNSETTMKEAYISYWKHSFKWGGRATRSDYWWPVLINFLIGVVLGVVGTLIPIINLVLLPFYFAMIFPSLSVWVRRYHDLGLSAWFAFIPQFVLLVLAIVAIIDGVLAYAGVNMVSFHTARTIFYMIGGFALVGFGIIWTYVFPCLPGQKEANKYGLPKA